jgi:hypothetical protein
VTAHLTVGDARRMLIGIGFVVQNDAALRGAIGRAIKSGLTRDDFGMVCAYADGQSFDEPGAWVWKQLRDLPTLQDLVASLRARAERKSRNRSESKSKQSAPGAHSRHCAAGNPYGWNQVSRESLSDPENDRDLDHNEPGQWNGFRQAYNLTESEAADEGRDGDYRRYGPSRWAAIGVGVDPAPDWDPLWDEPVPFDPNISRTRRDHVFDEDRGPQKVPVYEDPEAFPVYGERKAGGSGNA